MANKLNTAIAICNMVQSLASASDSGSDIVQEYYDIGGITDQDTLPSGVSAADLTACITLLEQFELFMSGGVVSAAQYRATLNKVRRV
jgi:hypothetical protein